MNKILVEVSVGELLDKISILEIKKEKIKDLEKLKFINDEYSVLKDQLNKNVEGNFSFVKIYIFLRIAIIYHNIFNHTGKRFDVLP